MFGPLSPRVGADESVVVYEPRFEKLIVRHVSAAVLRNAETQEAVVSVASLVFALSLLVLPGAGNPSAVQPAKDARAQRVGVQQGASAVRGRDRSTVADTLAQSRRGSNRTTPASNTAPVASGESAAESTQPAGTSAPVADEPEPDLELLRQRARITRRHKPLGIATWASMGLTVALGTMAAINRPTLFGPGMCSSADGYSVLGDFGCNGGLTGAHQLAALFTIGFYATTAVFAMSMPDPEHAAAGNDARGSTLRLHRAMAYIHFIGMLLTPILGVISVIPAVVGAPANVQSDFSAVMRTVHLGVGYVTFAALTVAMVLEF